jgi:hypothetical protein
MKNKEQLFKMLSKTTVIIFLLFSLYIVAFPPKHESYWMLPCFVVGIFTWFGIIMITIFGFVAICVCLVSIFLNWTFDTDYFG